MKVPYRVEDLTVRQAFESVVDDVWMLCESMTAVHHPQEGSCPSCRAGEGCDTVTLMLQLFPAWFPMADGVASEVGDEVDGPQEELPVEVGSVNGQEAAPVDVDVLRAAAAKG